MSDQTKDALEQAIRDHLKDEYPGNYLTSWAMSVQCEIIQDPDHHQYVYLVPDRQSSAMTIGLSQMMDNYFKSVVMNGE